MTRFPRVHLCLAALALSAAAACTGGDDSSAPTTLPPTSTTVAPTLPPTTTTTLPAPAPADVAAPQVVSAFGHGPGAGGELDPGIRDQLAAAVDRYLDAAIGAPLGSGGPADLGGLLTVPAAVALDATGRAVLTDEGLPPLVRLQTDRVNVAIEALAGPDGAVTLANVQIDVAVSAATREGGPVSITRRGTLTYVLEPEGWLIDAFELTVDRTLP